MTLALCLLAAPRQAEADGAASTRNIIFGTAAAAAGTLLIINHNKKVHEKYAEYDRQQAATQSEANQSQAAYESERQAYEHEANLVSEYKQETSVQHGVVKEQTAEIASLKRSLQLAKARPAGSRTTFVQQASIAPAETHVARTQSKTRPIEVATYGWGQY